jgi:L-ascorbate metabolism protein UlaG (beta-lactamase superfamily)
MKIGNTTKSKSRRIRVVVLTIGILIGLITLIMSHPLLGKRPTGQRLALIQKSPNYRDGKFRNFNVTPQVTQSIGIALYDYLFKKSDQIKPREAIPSKKVDWHTLPANKSSLVWLGHSSYLIFIDGITILVDPVLGQSASPIPGGTKAFQGTEVTTAADLPKIDYLFISHDHYDHMDYHTLKQIQAKVGKVIVGLGVGAHLEHWGYKPEQIVETDWWDKTYLDGGIVVTTCPARHFSGRSIWSANTLWASFVVETPSKKLYLGGDSGYDTHFTEIGNKLGPFDLAILENGQYDKSWKYIHMQPEEVIQAFKDLNAKVLLPVHSSKFALANHAWYEPLERISKLGATQHIPILTPIIGEIIDLDAENIQSDSWWQKIK